MFAVVVELVLVFLFEVVICTLVPLFLLSVVWIVCTPFILVGGLFQRKAYGHAVHDGYRGSTDAWLKFWSA